MRFPEWLADYIGEEPSEIRNKSLEELLEKYIPGVHELVMQVVLTESPVKGFKSKLIDLNGDSHALLLDAAIMPGSTTEKIVAIYFQELPPSKSDLEKYTFFGLVGASAKMQRVFNKIRMYAVSDAPVLITGETGAGKEGVASAIHELSKRDQGPFITMNCSAITDTLFESELFGHEKGSFTGAIKSHKGRFERANNGTLFLDELGDLPLLSQAKLLRVLETSTIETRRFREKT